MIDPITQNISPVTALPGLLAENRPAAVNQLVEEELPQLSIELENLVGELDTFIEQTNQTATDIEADKTATEQSAIIANGLANYQGVWSSATTYTKGQSVSSGTLYYISKVDSNLNHVVTDTNYWLPNPINDKINKNLSSETEKTTPVDADLIPLSDSAASFGLKKLTWANLKATILNALNGLTEKTTPIEADIIHIGDSESGYAGKKLTFANLKAMIFTDSALTGTPTAPTQIAGDNSTKLATTAYVDGKMVMSTAVNSTTGTAIDFTSVPSWVKRITIMLSDVSTNGTSPLQIQLGSGSISNSGYMGSNTLVIQGAVATSLFTTGFGVTVSTGNSSASAMLNGSCVINKLNSNTYTASGMFGGSHNAVIFYTAGAVTLSNVLDRIRLTSVNGIDLFDNGQINIMYEG